MSDMQIVLAVAAFMIVMLVWHKVPFGVTTMTCCAILAATGVVNLSTAFSGFGNKIIVLIAPMLAISAALGKTSLVARLGGMIHKLKGKQGIVLVLAIFVIGGALCQFIPNTAVLSMMLVFLVTLGNTGEITLQRIMLPLLGFVSAWKPRFPIGPGATKFALINGFYEGIISDPKYMLTMLDPFFYALPSMIVLGLFCIFGWKLMPRSNGELAGDVNTSAPKENRNAGSLTRGQEIYVFVVFTVMMALMILDKWTGLLYLAPATAVLMLLYGGVMKPAETIKAMTADMVWMIAGVLVVADALGKTGAGDAIGKLIIGVLGENPSSLMTMFVFSAVTVIMTTFLSNMGTQAILIPIAASMCLTAGWDPRGLMLIIGIANMLAVGFPAGSGEAAVAYAAGGYNPVKVLPFTLPYIILGIVTCALTAEFMYPIY